MLDDQRIYRVLLKNKKLSKVIYYLLLKEVKKSIFRDNKIALLKAF